MNAPRATAAVFVTAIVFGWLLLLVGVNADVLAVVIVAIAALPATLFVVLYAFTVRWWTFWIGRALMASSTGLASLIDISLLYRWLGDDYALRDFVRITVYMFVTTGAILKCLAILVDKIPLWTGRRARRDRDDLP